MKTKQRIFAMFMALCMCLTTLAPSAMAVSDVATEGTLICTEIEHVHGDACYKTVAKFTCGYDNVFESTNNVLTGQQTPPEDSMFTGMFTQGTHSEHVHTAECVHSTTVLICAIKEHMHTATCYQQGDTSVISDIFADTSGDMFIEDLTPGSEENTEEGDTITDLWTDDNDSVFEGEDVDEAEEEDGSEGDTDGSEWATPSEPGEGEEPPEENLPAEEVPDFDDAYIADYTNWMKYYDTDGDGQITFTVTYVLNKAIPIMNDGRSSLADLEVIRYRPQNKKPAFSTSSGEPIFQMTRNMENKEGDDTWQYFIPASIDASMKSQYLYEETRGLEPTDSDEELFEGGGRGVFGKFSNVVTGERIYEGYESAYYALSRETFILQSGMTVNDVLLSSVSYNLAWADAEYQFSDSQGYEDMIRRLGLDLEDSDVADRLAFFTSAEFTTLRDNMQMSPQGTAVQHGSIINSRFSDISTFMDKHGEYSFVNNDNKGMKQTPNYLQRLPERDPEFTSLLADVRVSGESKGDPRASSQMATTNASQISRVKSIPLVTTQRVNGVNVNVPAVCDGTNIYVIYSESMEVGAIDDQIQTIYASFTDMSRGEHFRYETLEGTVVNYPAAAVIEGGSEGYIDEAYSRGGQGVRVNYGGYGPFAGPAGFDNSYGVATGIFPRWNLQTGVPVTYNGYDVALSEDSVRLPLEFIKSGDNYTLLGSGMSQDTYQEIMEQSGVNTDGMTYDVHTGCRYGARVKEGGQWVGGVYSLYTAWDITHQLQWDRRSDSERSNLHAQFTPIYTNYFWPLPSVSGDVTSVSTYDSYWGYSYDDYLPEVWGNQVNVDLLKDVVHNEYFTMSFELEFTVPRGYVGPLDYFFFGDDDMIVYLDGECVVDLGGVHRSAGAYINLWDALPELRTSNELLFNSGTSTPSRGADLPENTHTLSIFYVERGGNGSTCYIDMTLPNMVATTQSTAGRDIIVEKEVISDNEDVDDDQFRFRVAVAADSITASDLQWDSLLSISADIYDDVGNRVDTVTLNYNNNLLVLEDGWEAHLRDVPYGYYVAVEEVDTPIYYTGDMNVYEGELLAASGNGTSAVYRVSKDVTAVVRFTCVNTDSRVARLPETGGTGVAGVYLAGVLICIAGGTLFIKRRELV